MGAFLDKPAIERHELPKPGTGSRAALNSIQGWRVNQEDAHILDEPMGGILDDVKLYAVFDGHGGKAVSQAVAAEFTKHVCDGIAAYCKSHSGAKPSDPATLEAALPDLFVSLDKAMHARVMSGKLEESGSTGVCVFVTPTHYVCANTGDSRAVLVRNGQAVALSEDHKPSNAEEKARIEAAGGIVSMDRVDGDLAVSRAFGDFRYKDNTAKSWADQKVSVVPEIRVVKRDPSHDELLLVACDGIWDVFSNVDASNRALGLARLGASPKIITRFLVDDALVRGSRDNMSLIVVALDNAPDAGAAARKMMEDADEAAEKGRQLFDSRGEPTDAAAAYLREIASRADAFSKASDATVAAAAQDVMVEAADVAAGKGHLDEDDEDEDGGSAETDGATTASSSTAAAQNGSTATSSASSSSTAAAAAEQED